jgi:hypothetical protein
MGNKRQQTGAAHRNKIKQIKDRRTRELTPRELRCGPGQRRRMGASLVFFQDCFVQVLNLPCETASSSSAGQAGTTAGVTRRWRAWARPTPTSPRCGPGHQPSPSSHNPAPQLGAALPLPPPSDTLPTPLPGRPSPRQFLFSFGSSKWKRKGPELGTSVQLFGLIRYGLAC